MRYPAPAHCSTARPSLRRPRCAGRPQHSRLSELYQRGRGIVMNLVAQFFTQSLIGRTTLGYFLIFGVPAVLPFLFVKLIGFKGLRHLFSYEPKQSVIHRLDPRIKVIYPVLIGILTIFLNWEYVYLLVAFTMVPWILVSPSPGRLRVIITMVGIPVIGAIWSQGLFHTEGLSTQHLLFIFPPT